MKKEKKSKPREYRVVIKFKVSSETAEKGKQLTKEALEHMGINVVSVKHISDKRTENQNNALHLWFDQIATEAEKKGITVDKWIKNPTEMKITESLLKDTFRETGRVMYGKESTADLTKEEFSEIVILFDKALLERIGVDIEFPNIDLLIRKDEERNNRKTS